MKKGFLLIFSAISICGFAQDNYLPGYIIKLNGDTINGFIDTDRPINNFLYCSFRAKQDSKPINYNANEISGYRYIDGKYFVSKEIQSDSVKKVKVFFQWLINAKINIYSFLNENSKVSYFAETQNNQLIELKDSKVEKFDEYNVKYEINKREYIGILTSLMHDCKEMIPIINNSQLNDKSLINVVKTYTEKVCNNSKSVVFESPKQRSKSAIFIVIGNSWSITNLNDISLFKSNEYSEKNSVLLGLNYSTSNLSYLSKHISFQTGIYFSNYSIIIKDRSEPELSFISIQIPFLVDYSIFIHNAEPFCSAGVQLLFKMNQKLNNDYLKAVSAISYGPCLGLGFKYKISKNYISQFNLSYTYAYKYLFGWQKYFSNIFSIQLKIGYLF
jgi:hypothetical protein